MKWGENLPRDRQQEGVKGAWMPAGSLPAPMALAAVLSALRHTVCTDMTPGPPRAMVAQLAQLDAGCSPAPPELLQAVRFLQSDVISLRIHP